MKYLILIVAASLMSVTFSIQADAQILNRLKKKTKEAAEQKAEEKLAEQTEKLAAQMVEQSWNSIFGEVHADSLVKDSPPFSMNSSVTTESTYHFDTITTMEIKNTKKNGQSDPPMTMDMYFNENALYTGAKFDSEEMRKENGDLFIIYDSKNSAMLMLMSKDEEKFSFAYGWKHALTKAAEAAIDKDVNWDEVEEWEGYTKIGSKNILGYSCDGYRSDTDSGSIEMWVSRDADFGINNLFRAHTNTKQMKGKVPDNYPQGMIMKMISEDIKTGDKVTMSVIAIKKDAQVSYTMADYPAMSLGLAKSQN